MESASGKKTVFVVDDHPLVREWLTNLINQQPDLSVCGEADTITATPRSILARQPDVAVVDIAFKDSSGLALVAGLKRSFPELPILVLSMHDESHYAERPSPPALAVIS